MRTPITLTLAIGVLLLPFSCGSSRAENNLPASGSTPSDAFNAYWERGLAEITSYHLEQARYGEIREGEAVLVFVTEPFSKSKHVKLDNPSATPKDAVQVLKLNSTRKFITGIYPYSMMSSTFTPVNANGPGALLKATCTSQEWCGHTFGQWDKEGSGYSLAEYSYFESEGDRQLLINGAFLEDELWTLLRISPDLIPEGKIRLIPSQFYSRLRHTGPGAYEAEVTKTEAENGTTALKVRYTSLDRELMIVYSNEFPYEIQAWEESYTSGFGPSAERMVTKGSLNKRIMLDYWQHNGLMDEAYRDSLGLN